MGVQHLQTLADITGFEVERRIRTDLSAGAVVLGILLYPFLALGSVMTWLSYRKKNPHVSQEVRDRVFRQRVLLNLSPVTLFCRHTFWVLGKRLDSGAVTRELKQMSRPPDSVT
jgi:hypothetical protein